MLVLHLTNYLNWLGRILTLAAIAAIADGLVRMRATDFPSMFSIHITGTAPPSPRYFFQPFGINVSAFRAQSEDLIFHNPDQVATRTRILDYFISQQEIIKDDHLIFQFDVDMQPGNCAKLLEQLCWEIGYPPDNIPSYLSGEQTELLYNYPELKYYRDIIFLFKYLMNPKADALPEIKPWMQKVIK